MSELAAQLVDRVIPQVPVRQWVLSLPFGLRYQLAFDTTLTAAVLDVFIRSVFAAPRSAKASPMPNAAPSVDPHPPAELGPAPADADPPPAP